jgi:hypothetical protein
MFSCTFYGVVFLGKGSRPQRTSKSTRKLVRKSRPQPSRICVMDCRVSALGKWWQDDVKLNPSCRGVQQIPELRAEPRFRGYTGLRLPSGSVHPSSQEYRRSRRWRIRLDEAEQRKGMGSHETARFTQPPPRRECSTQRISKSTRRRRN